MRRIRTFVIVGAAGVAAPLLCAQVSPSEHAAHHPAGSAPGPAAAQAMPASGGMGEMMGGPVTKEVYPSLMELPAFTAEKRVELDHQAVERMASGLTQMSTALAHLNAAMSAENYASVQEHTAFLHESLARFESGIAARRALRENQVPRAVALNWFKKEMNLLPPLSQTDAETSWFHWSVMASLIAFAGAMVAMYFFKMRRATELIAKFSAGGTGRAGLPELVAPVTDRPSGLSGADKFRDKVRVAQIFLETPEVKTYRLVGQSGGRPFPFSPGQFLNLTVELEGKPVTHSYTIASSPTEGAYLELTIKREPHAGVSNYLHQSLKEGDLISVAGPFGSFVFTGREAENIVLLGAGVGITPLMSVTRFLTATGWRGHIYLGVCFRDLPHYIYRTELELLAQRHPNFHLVTTITQASAPWNGLRGRFTREALLQAIPSLVTMRVHICGPESFMVSTRAILTELGVPAAQIKTELFGTASAPRVAAKIAKPQVDQESAPVTASNVTFVRSGKTVALSPGATVLDAAEENGIVIDASCRAGTCGVCKVRLLGGKVSMAVEEALDAEDRRQGVILACQAKASENITVDA
jgi:glycine betaine catabolism B